MKRNRLSRIENEGPGAMDISSLVDICFLLLIYFIVTTTIVPRERDLPVGTPRDGREMDVVVQPYMINIDASGQISSGEEVNQVPLDADASVRDLPLLTASLEFYQQGVRAAGEECLVVINADGEATSQRVVDVLNALAGLNINKVTFTDWQEEE